MGTGATVGWRIFDEFGKFFLDAYKVPEVRRLEQGTFKQVNLADMSLSGVSSVKAEQKVTDPQLKETNATLKRIAASVAKDNVAVAG